MHGARAPCLIFFLLFQNGSGGWRGGGRGLEGRGERVGGEGGGSWRGGGRGLEGRGEGVGGVGGGGWRGGGRALTGLPRQKLQ